MTASDVSPAASDVSARLATALEIAREAGQITSDFFQQSSVRVERKNDDSPVTQADRLAEQAMRSHIAKLFPTDAIVGEEFGETRGTSGYSWIIDPIDGTKSFISGVPLYSVLVGVVYRKRSVVGVILIPELRECVYASQEEGAWWICGDDTPRRARVSDCPALSEGLFLTSQVDSFAKRGAAEAFSRLEQAAYISRTWGDGYGYLLIATGRAAAMVDADMHVWDAAAVQPILIESGGTFTDWCGEPTIYGGEGVGTNGRCLQEVLEITRQYPRRP